MKKTEFFGAMAAVSDLDPAAPDSTKAPAAVTRATTTTNAPATPQRKRRERGEMATG